MKNELLDFTAQENFDFFKYRYIAPTKGRAEFLSDCKKVIETAQKSFLERLKLAWRMAKIKRNGEWKYVINPDDKMSFNYSSFEKFSEYAYGFGRTLTSDLLGLSQFVDYDEKLDKLTFKRPEYAKMGQSKLVELVPLPDTYRQYFRADMTVKDMRLCKKYVNDGYLDFCKKQYQDGFDLLASAQAWEAGKIRQEEERQVQEVDEELRKAASEPSDETETGRVIFYDEPDEPDEPDEEEADEIPTSGFETPIFAIDEREKPRSAYRFTSRADVRKFLAKYESWERHYFGNTFFDEVWKHIFKNGVTLYAATCKMCANAESGAEKDLLFFFLSQNQYTQTAIKISKSKLEIWLRAHEAELLGVEE